MDAYWKIPKKWVKEWGLTATEALVLADMTDWPRCTISERANRCGLSKRGVIKVEKKLKEKVYIDGEQSTPKTVNKVHQNGEQSTPKTVNKVHQNGEQSTPKTVNKVHQNGEQSTPKTVNKVHQNGEQSTPPPTPPYIGEQGEQEEHRRLTTTITTTTTLGETDRLSEEEKNGTIGTTREFAEELKKEIDNGGTFAESILRMYGINQEQLVEYLDWFVDHLYINGVTIKSRGDFRRHLNSWLRIQAEKILKNQKDENKQQRGVTDDFIRRTAERVAASGGLAF